MQSYESLCWAICFGLLALLEVAFILLDTIERFSAWSCMVTIIVSSATLLVVFNHFCGQWVGFVSRPLLRALVAIASAMNLTKALYDIVQCSNRETKDYLFISIMLLVWNCAFLLLLTPIVRGQYGRAPPTSDVVQERLIPLVPV